MDKVLGQAEISKRIPVIIAGQYQIIIAALTTLKLIYRRTKRWQGQTCGFLRSRERQALWSHAQDTNVSAQLFDLHPSASSSVLSSVQKAERRWPLLLAPPPRRPAAHLILAIKSDLKAISNRSVESLRSFQGNLLGSGINSGLLAHTFSPILAWRAFHHFRIGLILLTWALMAAKWICLARKSNFFIDRSSCSSLTLLYSWPSIPLVWVRFKASMESCGKDM